MNPVHISHLTQVQFFYQPGSEKKSHYNVIDCRKIVCGQGQRDIVTLFGTFGHTLTLRSIYN